MIETHHVEVMPFRFPSDKGERLRTSAHLLKNKPAANTNSATGLFFVCMSALGRFVDLLFFRF